MTDSAKLPLSQILTETEPAVVLSILRYINCIRALQGLAPRTTIRQPSYRLGPLRIIHCPFWLSCVDTEHLTPVDMLALQSLMHINAISFLPAWLFDWTKRHEQLWHEYLKNNV